MKIDKRLKVVLKIGVVLWLIKACSWNWYYQDVITYYSPIWVTNNKIAFIKRVQNIRYDSNYPLYMKVYRISDGAILTIRDDFYVCTMDINNGEKAELIRIQRDWPFSQDPHYPGSISLNNDSSKVLVNWAEKPGTGHKETGFIIIDLKTKEQKKLSGSGQGASFSSDGTKILYADFGICTMNLDGGDKQQITTNIEDIRPLLSPNGKILAFDRNDGEHLLDISSGKERMIGRYGFINWTTDNNYIWSARGLIDCQGGVIKKYDIVRENKVIPFGPLSLDGGKMISDYYQDYIYVGDLNGNLIMNIKAYQEKKYGKIDRSAKKVIWIE